MKHYILDGHTPVECDLMTWAMGMEQVERIVCQTDIGAKHISTVFLGLDHNWGRGPPQLFETMIFTKDGGGVIVDRCATWIEAEAMHGAACALVQFQLAATKTRHGTA